MSETENLFKIQALIDEHKETIPEGEYLNMVNYLMNVWKKKSNQYKGYTLEAAYNGMEEAYSGWIEERKQHELTRRRISTMKTTTKSLRKQIAYQKEQIVRLKNMKNQQNEVDNIGVGRCKYIFTKGQFMGEFCGACCKNDDRCNKHKKT
tara:strand:+ start:26 stop:475 length:450 start_codon:yes stop_codon:yes gene_type:complete